MNIDQLLKEKTQILRNNLGESVMGVSVEDLEGIVNAIRVKAIRYAVNEYLPTANYAPDDMPEGFSGYCEALAAISECADKLPVGDQQNKEQ